MALKHSSAVARKPYAWGSYNLLGSNKPIPPKQLDYDYIKGHRIRTGWQDVQTDLKSKEINTVYIEGEIAKAAAAGQKIGCGVSAGVSVPVALWDIPGVTKYEIPPDEITIENCPPFMPLPWEAPFQKYWFNAIKQLGLRFDGDPNISYWVISGMMQLMENRFAGSADSEAVVQDLAKKAGYADFSTAWTVASQAIVDTYCRAFPTTPLLLTMAKVIPSDSKVDDDLVSWAQAKYPGRFGTMLASLKATLPPHAPNKNPGLLFPKQAQPISGSGDHERYYGKNNPIPDPFPVAPQLADDMGRAGITLDNNLVEFYGSESGDPANADTFRALNIEFEALAKKAEAVRPS